MGLRGLSSRNRIVISFEVWKDHGIGLIEADGILDAYALPALRQAIDEALQLAAHQTIAVIDATVTIIDPAPLGALLAEHKRSHEHGGTLAVIGTNGLIAKALRSFDVGHSVPIFATLDDALTTLSGKTDP